MRNLTMSKRLTNTQQFASRFVHIIHKIGKNIGLSMILKDYWDIGQNIIVQTLDGQKRNGTITSLPFPD